MISRIYIAHCERDEKLAQELARTLWAVELENFSFLSKKTVGLSRAELINFGINHSDCVIAILSQEGVESPAVNQEVGLAVGRGQLIIPLLETGEELPVLIRHLHSIRFSRKNYENALGQVIHTIRQLTRLNWLKIKCPNCGEVMTQYIAPEEEVETALLAGNALKTICTYCEQHLSLNPQTLRPILADSAQP
ncbi:toll/interleukin-1 receptor domain-containing protein [Methanohalophilus mahii]|uniref:TIR domain-containing protein n=1 Tax=Methanohalophilus mahii (strain ATCC 35705 / DSM 5219 / SLP) TaxID=547558 RepID=D5EBM5_METMS|nr:toll/interleukin-1 receptor domain-containing protein [Methanohalophilus mahii]ADE36576.1 hypothetical protein Mmah_1067 [Methanohalophilus mahii DSM 5219]